MVGLAGEWNIGNGKSGKRGRDRKDEKQPKRAAVEREAVRVENSVNERQWNQKDR